MGVGLNYEVTVLTTSKNYGRFLEDCITSVLNQQTVFPLKINHLIMDGASTDNTPDILRRYKKYLHAVINKDDTQTKALIRGMEIIESNYPNTEYLGWLNADDFYNPCWAQASISMLRRETENVAMTCGRYNQLGVPPELVEKVKTREAIEERTPPIPYVRIDTMARGNVICQPTVCIKFSAFKELKRIYGYYFNSELDFVQDVDIWHRFLLEGYRIRRIPERVATLRRHPKRLTKRYRKLQRNEGVSSRRWLRSKMGTKSNPRVAFIWHVKTPKNFWKGKIDSMQNAIERVSELYETRVFVSSDKIKPRRMINGQDITFYKHASATDLINHLNPLNPNIIFMNVLSVPLWRDVIINFPTAWKFVMDYGSTNFKAPLPESLGGVIVQQEYQRSLVAKANDLPLKDVRVNPFCVDTDLFKPLSLSKPYTGVMVADFRKDIKRQHLLIRAWRKIPGKLLLIGRFERSLPRNFHRSCMNIVARHGMSERIDFMDGCPRELLPKVINSAKIAYMTSKREGGSRALYEMMGCGLPALVMEDCPGLTHMIESEVDGLIAKPNVKDIMVKTKKLLKNYERMGEAATERIRRDYPYERMTQFYFELIKEFRFRSGERP